MGKENPSLRAICFFVQKRYPFLNVKNVQSFDSNVMGGGNSHFWWLKKPKRSAKNVQSFDAYVMGGETAILVAESAKKEAKATIKLFHQHDFLTNIFLLKQHMIISQILET